MFLSSQREFAGDPVVRTPRFHFRGNGFNPWLGKSNPTSFARKFAKVCTVLQPASWTTDSQKRKGGREEERKEGRKEKGEGERKEKPPPLKKNHKEKKSPG